MRKKYGKCKLCGRNSYDTICWRCKRKLKKNPGKIINEKLYCSSSKCPNKSKKFFKKDMLPLSVNGLTLYFCSRSCLEGVKKLNES